VARVGEGVQDGHRGDVLGAQESLTKCEPMKPAPPVTSTVRMGTPMAAGGRGQDDTEHGTANYLVSQEHGNEIDRT
jgi:hypothetical protein